MRIIQLSAGTSPSPPHPCAGGGGGFETGRGRESPPTAHQRGQPRALLRSQLGQLWVGRGVRETPPGLPGRGRSQLSVLERGAAVPRSGGDSLSASLSHLRGPSLNFSKQALDSGLWALNLGPGHPKGSKQLVGWSSVRQSGPKKEPKRCVTRPRWSQATRGGLGVGGDCWGREERG